MDVERFLSDIVSRPEYRGQIRKIHVIPARPARFADLIPPPPEPLMAALRARGIERFYVHQVAAIEHARAGRHVVVVTSTASGKSLCYNVPVLETILRDQSARALYLFPTKALAQDQLKALNQLAEHLPESAFVAGTYDGDTPRSRRRTLREKANILLTNPDMLHSGILPSHSRWAHFFGQLRFVVVDEMHVYRGIFGTNVALLLRRLRRICRHHGADPTFICCSATIANPDQHAAQLIGAPVELVDDDGSAAGAKTFVLWNPPVVDRELGLRRAADIEARWLMTALIADYGAQVIAFLRARRSAELLYRYVREALEEVRPQLAGRVRSYRGGYLPQERREIERALFSGELLGVTSTNALELGIDIGCLDACLSVGYPGSVSSTWQQAGRAGRGTDESLAILIAKSNPVDQYLMEHGEYFFDQTHEAAVIDPENPFVLAGHLRCAMQELPLDGSDLELFGPLTSGIVQILADEGEAMELRGTWFWTGPEHPAGDISLRNADPNNYVIQDVTDGTPQVIGMVDEWSAFTLLHDEAVYLHNGETYFVQKLDTEARVATVVRQELDYYTVAIDKTRIVLLRSPDEPPQERQMERMTVGRGPVEVTSRVFMFRKIKFYRNESIGYGAVKLPEHRLVTQAVYIAPDTAVLAALRQASYQPQQAMLGAANAIAGVLPPIVSCDPADVGTVVDSANLGLPAIFVYDRYPGGVGYAERVYDNVSALLEAALELVEACPCEAGCPSCVGPPVPLVPKIEDIDTRSAAPDKAATLALLNALVRGEMPAPAPAAPEALEPIGQAMERPADSQREPVEAARPLRATRLPSHVEKEIRKRIALWRQGRGGIRAGGP